MAQNKCVQIFKALSDETRQKILEFLEEREMCVNDIVERFNMSQPTISHHLNILKNAELVETRREGKQTYYFPNSSQMVNCCVDFFKKFDIIIKERDKVS